MTTSIYNTGNPSFLFGNQSITHMLYSPVISFGLDYGYSRWMDKISSDNSMSLGIYGGITTLITKV